MTKAIRNCTKQWWQDSIIAKPHIPLSIVQIYSYSIWTRIWSHLQSAYTPAREHSHISDLLCGSSTACFRNLKKKNKTACWFDIEGGAVHFSFLTLLLPAISMFPVSICVKIKNHCLPVPDCCRSLGDYKRLTLRQIQIIVWRTTLFYFKG